MSDQNPRSNPYVGPRSFRTGEKIYGRERELRELLNLLIAERIVLLFSPSGAGKTSLIQAGLIPLLLEENFYVMPTARLNLEPPTSIEVDEHFNRYAFSFLLSLEEALPPEKRKALSELAGLSLEAYLDEFPRPEDAPSSEILLIDQFEEILTVDPTDQASKLAFFTQLGAVLRNRNRWALLSIREDYVASLDPYLRPIPTRLANTFRIDLLNADAARQAIIQPASLTGVEFTGEAANKLIDDLRRIHIQRPDGTIEEQTGPYVEPVQLQVVCYRIWESLSPEATQITDAEVAASGDVDQALAEYYADRVLSAAQQTGVKERAIREWVDTQLITERGLRNQVLREPGASGGLDNRAIAYLDHAHLIRAEKRGGATWFELAHDRLVRPVRENNANWLLTHLHLLQRQASSWERNDHATYLLLREADLLEAEKWAEEYPDELTEADHEFLAACRDARTKEHIERERAENSLKLEAAQKVAEAERQRAEDQHIAASKLRRRAVILSITLLVALAAAVFAMYFWNQATQSAEEANQQRSEALAQRSTAQAYSILADQGRVTAVAAQSTAIMGQSTAEAASIQALAGRATSMAAEVTAIAGRDAAATAQVYAEQQRDEAERQGRIALSRGLSSLALNTMDRQLDLSLLMAIEAFRAIEQYPPVDTLQARNALLTGLQRGLTQASAQSSTKLPTQTSWIFSVAFSPDGSKVAWGGAEGMLVLWDVVENRYLTSRLAHSNETIYSMDFNPAGDILATGGGDGKVNLWRVSDAGLAPYQQFSTQHPAIYSLAISPDGSKLATVGKGNNIYIWDIVNNAFLRAMTTRSISDNWSVAWSADGKFLATGGGDRNVRIWDAASGSEVTTLKGHEGTVLALAWDPELNRLASGGADEEGKADKTILIWDLTSGVATPLEGHLDRVLSLAFSPDGNSLASGSADRTTILWDARSLSPVNSLTDHSHWVTGVDFSATRPATLAAGSFDRSVILYDIITQRPLNSELAQNIGSIQSLYFGEETVVEAIDSRGNLATLDVETSDQEKRPLSSIVSAPVSAAFSPDGTKLALGYEDGEIKVLDAQTGSQLLPSMYSEAGEVLSMAFSPDNQTLAASVCSEADAELDICVKNDIQLWDLAAGTLRDTHTSSHTDLITSLAFSPDGETLASGSKDRSIILWDLATQTALGAPLAKHDNTVASLTFSQDGTMLASGDQDGELILWDRQSYQPIGETFPVSSDTLDALAFSPSGNSLAFSSANGNIVLLDLNPASWITRACALAGRNMSQAEWEQFIPGSDYRLTCSEFPQGE